MAVDIGLSEYQWREFKFHKGEKQLHIYICKWYIIGKFENMLFSEYE